ncbi:hypothetical protein K491DRAFT_692840 [Lophiostoma macrostomum CBS 122681]|uniref:Uncharacterized protein n=1 Tax=Lophiostoma macrostomum CBS 122681 TaxID=1314788 RepID=A0A6A6T6Y0_9PLEO|nr:hypothetical protein K491DRAFT_692840 [Lophiostoma macrostomum CBS 122681]
MPVQRTFLGRPIRLQMPPRRFQLLFIFVGFFIYALFVYGPPSSADIPSYEQVSEAVKHPHLPNLPDIHKLPDLPDLSIPKVFGPSAHKPPVQPNSTTSSSYRAIEWFADFKWRNPFSSTITLDENRAVLPPLKRRPPIYTYYDARGKEDKEVSEAENRLILAWRRAWWAQGFQPQVLSRDEAQKHPQYELVQRMRLGKIDPRVELEMMRWLAWGHMRGGILTNWLALPMAKYDNPMLSFLRRQEYPFLSRIESLQNGVFFGEAAAVEEAIKKAIGSELFKNTTANKDKIAALKNDAGAIVNLLTKDDIAVDSKANGVAYYSTSTINSAYKSLGDKLGDKAKAEGLDLLATLINSHLHLTFQTLFPDGLAVVKPLPEHTTALMDEAIEIARNLTQCAASPLPKSCPPNLPKCSPCDPAKPLKLELIPSLKNVSALYTVGTVPHPYTLNSLHYMRDSIDAEFLRREAHRDMWISALTKGSLGEQHSGADHVLYFKEAVASPTSVSNSLWLTAERPTQADLDWVFGFNLPQKASTNDEPTSKSGITIFPRAKPPKPLEGVKPQEEKWLRTEEDRLKKARQAIKSTDKNYQSVVAMVEQWNLADTEAWKFSRAFSARRRVERKKWEEEEQKYAGSEKKSGVQTAGGGSRWSD